MAKNQFIKTLALVFFAISTSTAYSQIKNARLVVQNGHSLKVNEAIFSPNGNYVASCSADNSIILWDAKSGKQIRTFIGHKDEVNSICFSKDGRLLYSGSGSFTSSQDNSIKVWNINSGKCIKTIPCDEHIVDIKINEKFIVTAHGKSVKTRNIEGLNEVKSFPSLDYISCMDISPRGNVIVYCTGKNDIKISDFQGNIIAKILEYSYDPIYSVKWSSDGKYIITSQGVSRANTEKAERYITLWEYPSLKKIKTFLGHDDCIESVCFSPDNNYILSGSFDKTIRLWEIQTGNEVKVFMGHSGHVSSVGFSADGKSIVSASWDYSVKIWNLSSGELSFNLCGKIKPENYLTYSNDGIFLFAGTNYGFVIWDMVNLAANPIFLSVTPNEFSITLSQDNSKLICWNHNQIYLWDRLNDKITETRNTIGYIYNIAISPNNELLAISDRFSISLISLDDGSILDKIGVDNKFPECKFVFTPDGNSLVIAKSYEEILFWDFKNNIKSSKLTGLRYGITALAISPDQKYVAISSHDKCVLVFDLSTKKLYYKSPVFIDPFNSLCFSKDSKLLACGTGYFYDEGNVVKVFDIEKKEEIHSLKGHTRSLTSVTLSPDSKYLASIGRDNLIYIWDLQSEKKIANMYLVGEKDWLINTDDGYFDCSRNGYEGLALESNLRGIGIDQLAYMFNRPDKILDAFNQKSELSQYYKQCYQKRLKRMRIDEKKLSSNIHVPQVILNNTKVEGNFAVVDFELTDNKYNIESYNIFINDVPLFGVEGRKVSGSNANLNEQIELTNGKNKIEISCINEKGAESYRALTYANCNSQSMGDLYLLTFGVSKYKDTSLNLQFADKDAIDLSKVIETYKGKGFENVYTKILTNEQVTPEAIKASKDFVKNAKPDDTFILFIAGHGVHDSDPEATYYYLTSNADINNLKGTAADFETIEDLLQGIPPRNKLFLMDACESGEIDEEDQGQMIAAATGVGINSRGFKSTSSQSTNQPITQSSKRSYLYQKDRYIYNDLVRRSGAIVFSSSKGGELSYERSDIENGLFTEYIMKALTTTEADKDSNGVVSTDELRNYVSAEVAKASGDLQHPTVDRDNIYQKFGFQIK
jgi:WD40 repeat protein/uncharacterized caspase-like protein